jgi:hypothetical protein
MLSRRSDHGGKSDRSERAMKRTHSCLWIFPLFGVLMSCASGTAEDIDPRLEKVLADWQKRQNAFRSVRYEVRGEHKVPKGAYNSLDLGGKMRGPQLDQPIPPQDLVGTVTLTLLLDFVKGRHRSQLRVPQYHLNSGKFVPLVKESIFDGSVAKGAMPREENPSLGSGQPEFSVVSGNMKFEEFRSDYFPIFFGHGRIYTVFEPIIPGQLRNKPDAEYLYVHGTGVRDGRTCLIVRTQTLKTVTTSFDEYWVDTEREGAILRHVGYCNSKPSHDIMIRYRKTSAGWLPESWRLEIYNESLLYTDNMRVRKVDLDPAINDADFQMEIKPGMIVDERTDLPTKHPLVNPESKISVYRAKEGGGREELPDPARRKGDQYQEHIRRKNLWVWAWLVLPVLALGGFLAWVRRRRRAS